VPFDNIEHSRDAKNVNGTSRAYFSALARVGSENVAKLATDTSALSSPWVLVAGIVSFFLLVVVLGRCMVSIVACCCVDADEEEKRPFFPPKRTTTGTQKLPVLISLQSCSRSTQRHR
jgi:hypothetical protein